jgi:hypothetical protein
MDFWVAKEPLDISPISQTENERLELTTPFPYLNSMLKYTSNFPSFRADLPRKKKQSPAAALRATKFKDAGWKGVKAMKR